jgi:serine/threonine protein kinase
MTVPSISDYAYIISTLFIYITIFAILNTPLLNHFLVAFGLPVVFISAYGFNQTYALAITATYVITSFTVLSLTEHYVGRSNESLMVLLVTAIPALILFAAIVPQLGTQGLPPGTLISSVINPVINRLPIIVYIEPLIIKLGARPYTFNFLLPAIVSIILSALPMIPVEKLKLTCDEILSYGISATLMIFLAYNYITYLPLIISISAILAGFIAIDGFLHRKKGIGAAEIINRYQIPKVEADRKSHEELHELKTYFKRGDIKILATLNGFKIIDLIGDGAYSYVFLAEDERGKKYALKVVKPVNNNPPSNKELMNIFRELIKLMEVKAKYLEPSDLNKFPELLNSENKSSVASSLNAYRRYIVNVVSYNQRVWEGISTNPLTQYYRDMISYIDNPPYIVLEYADMGDLISIRDELIKQPKKVLFLLDAILGALAFYYVSSGGSIHCDLKPENILIKSGIRGMPEPRIVDFGITRKLGEMEREGWNIGTPHYMPPEHLLYPGRGITPDYDVYSISVTIYELITGDLPIRQNYFISISKHPLLSNRVKEESSEAVNIFEESIFGTKNIILPKVEEIIYNEDRSLWSLDTEISRSELIKKQNDRLMELDQALRVDEIVSTIQTMELKILKDHLVKYNLSMSLADIIMKGLQALPHKRFSSPLNMWLKLREIMIS